MGFTQDEFNSEYDLTYFHICISIDLTDTSRVQKYFYMEQKSIAIQVIVILIFVSVLIFPIIKLVMIPFFMIFDAKCSLGSKAPLGNL